MFQAASEEGIKHDHVHAQMAPQVPKSDGRIADKVATRERIKKNNVSQAQYNCHSAAYKYTTNHKWNITRHLASPYRTNRKLLRCERKGCYFTTACQGSLHHHQRRMHVIGPKPQFKGHFSRCDAVFFGSSELTRAHFKSKHRIKMPFACSQDVCSFSTAHKSNLNRYRNLVQFKNYESIQSDSGFVTSHKIVG